MDVFGFRDQLISAYAEYITSFIQIRDPLIKQHVDGTPGCWATVAGAPNTAQSFFRAWQPN